MQLGVTAACHQMRTHHVIHAAPHALGMTDHCPATEHVDDCKAAIAAVDVFKLNACHVPRSRLHPHHAVPADSTPRLCPGRVGPQAFRQSVNDDRGRVGQAVQVRQTKASSRLVAHRQAGPGPPHHARPVHLEAVLHHRLDPLQPGSPALRGTLRRRQPACEDQKRPRQLHHRAYSRAIVCCAAGTDGRTPPSPQRPSSPPAEHSTSPSCCRHTTTPSLNPLGRSRCPRPRSSLSRGGGTTCRRDRVNRPSRSSRSFSTRSSRSRRRSARL